MACCSSPVSVPASVRTTSMRLSRAAILMKISTAFLDWPAERYISPAARRSPSSSEEAACLRMRPCAMDSSTAFAPTFPSTPGGAAMTSGSPMAAFTPFFSPCCAQCLASSHFLSSVYISTAMLYCFARPKCCAASAYLPWKARTCAVTSCSSSWVRLERFPYCCVILLRRSMYLMSRMRMKALREMSKRRLCSASSAKNRQSASVTPRHATL
mmetsp:Transcript_60560/g.159217  ORF Transcript_60560/g.159217 Transcript_60560/m.159217 type:complete len:213 (-) Transcript_60560:1747-2385(-)